MTTNTSLSAQGSAHNCILLFCWCRNQQRFLQPEKSSSYDIELTYTPVLHTSNSVIKSIHSVIADIKRSHTHGKTHIYLKGFVCGVNTSDLSVKEIIFQNKSDVQKEFITAQLERPKAQIIIIITRRN